MQYLSLTSTPLFMRLKNDEKSHCMDKAYHQFAGEVFEMCCKTDEVRSAMFTLLYTEIELRYILKHPSNRGNDDAELTYYIDKAISLIAQTLKKMRGYHRGSPPLNVGESFITIECKHQWTSSVVDLVELVYALNEVGCIECGDIPISDLVDYIGSVFGVEVKDCYGAYGDIKRRKQSSRTYFIDKMAKRLNERMDRDDAK